jgi:outer membrane receptor protein involved in Fe transport
MSSTQDLRRRGVCALALALSVSFHAAPGCAQDGNATSVDRMSDAIELDRITVVGRRQNLVGEAISASEGVVGQGDIADRPMLRTGDLLEFVPGLIATSHSGSGKANQYFLRGFNLDHGTDFATSVDGMPVNMRTHGHGQGYTDLNFLIPETVEDLTYRKGTYYADAGDFSSAGSAQFHLADSVAAGQMSSTFGQDGYRRAVLLDSARFGTGDLLFAGEAQTYDGPWTDIDEDVHKGNLLLRYGFDAGPGRAHVTLMGYENTWNSPDQIPQRAVDRGLISEFGSIDPDVGGESSRYSLSGGWKGAAFGGDLDATAYYVDSSLQLYSDFTYFLDNPVDGDEFEQIDDRKVYGFDISQQWTVGRSRWRAGAEGRFDDIGRVALLRTDGRRLVGTVRDDSVEEGSAGVFVANEFRFSDRWRSYVGVRRDQYRFDVDSSLAANSGNASDGITSYKGSLAYQPVDGFELYASYGTGFHSNDARGTTIAVDPVTGDSAQKVDPLVRSKGAELGARIHFSDQLQATIAVWSLQLDSELLFVGDAGATEASQPSRRDGIELGMYWFPDQHLSVNLEASYTDAYFEDEDAAGDEIPGAIPLVVGTGVSYHADGWSVSAQVKHFGRYPLIEDGSVESKGSTILNLRAGREWVRWGLFLDVLNALDSDDHDIDYFYASRLPGEAAGGVDDVHFHVFPSRSLRASVRYTF